MTTTLRCTKCGKHQRPDAFSLNRAHPSGRQNWCRRCSGLYKGEGGRRCPACRETKARSLFPRTKAETCIACTATAPTLRCSGCSVERQRSEFHKNARRANGLQSLCKTCVNAPRRTGPPRVPGAPRKPRTPRTPRTGNAPKAFVEPTPTPTPSPKASYVRSFDPWTGEWAPVPRQYFTLLKRGERPNKPKAEWRSLLPQSIGAW